jgi:hypothetical protein
MNMFYQNQFKLNIFYQAVLKKYDGVHVKIFPKQKFCFVCDLKVIF